MPVQPRRKPRAVGRPVKQRASENVRERLLDAALTLFAEKGYVATGTQEIIDAAGVTKPVLYHYFESKEALFRELVGGIYDATAVAWDAVLAQESKAIARLRGILQVSFEGSARDPRLPRLLLQTHYGPPIAELRAFMEAHTARRFGSVVNIMRGGLESAELRGGDASSLALLFCCLMDQHINALTRLPNGPALLTPARADAILDAFLHGCGSTHRGTVALPPLPLG